MYALVELVHVLSRLAGEKLVEVYVIPTDDDYLIAERLEQILDPLLGVVERRVEPDNSDQVYDEKQVFLNLGWRIAFVYLGGRVDQDSKELDVRDGLVHERLDLVLQLEELLGVGRMAQRQEIRYLFHRRVLQLVVQPAQIVVCIENFYLSSKAILKKKKKRKKKKEFNIWKFYD